MKTLKETDENTKRHVHLREYWKIPGTILKKTCHYTQRDHREYEKRPLRIRKETIENTKRDHCEYEKRPLRIRKETCIL